MDQESIVYGCIKDVAEFELERRRANRIAVLSLPKSDSWSFLCQEMFSVPSLIPTTNHYQTEVLHFGASYKAIEYEWAQWVKDFERLLGKMYWHSAVVHLETELAGVHSFYWEATNNHHVPESGDLRVRCEWVRERGLASRPNF